ncbi:MAG: hypothetical protein N3I35_15650 [Clostridia bacterium]|nr:hypothetical protein [Clostridia bacterium]
MIGELCKCCVNDRSVSGIKFDETGTCSYCSEYYRYEDKLNDFDCLEKLWMERINTYKGKGPYDAIMGISGGKDSTYVLYQLVNTYKLKVLAVSVDNGFLNDWSKDRIASITSELGVEHRYITYPEELLKKLYVSSIKAVASPCIACSYMIYMGSISYAAELGIPMMIHGRSPAQMLKYFSSEKSPDMVIPFLFSSLKHINEVNLDNTYKDVYDSFKRIFPVEFMDDLTPLYPDFKGKQPVEFMPYFVYHKYNETEMVDFLEKHMKWKRPDNYELMSHYDCDAHDAGGYLYEIAEGRPHIMPELSVAVRQGLISRDEAIKTLYRSQMSSLPEKSMNALSKYVGLDKDFLQEIARGVAERKRAALANIKRKEI